MNKDLGQLIKLRREEYGLSQACLAHRAKMSPSYLSKIENGERDNPSYIMMLEICVALDIPFEELGIL